TSSAIPRARRTMSTCPRVMGSKDPGHTATRVLTPLTYPISDSGREWMGENRRVPRSSSPSDTRKFAVLRNRQSGPYVVFAGMSMMGDNVQHPVGEDVFNVVAHLRHPGPYVVFAGMSLIG